MTTDSPVSYAQARALVARALRGRRDPELEAAAWAGLHRALERYDPARGPFDAWASYVMRQCLQNQYRAWATARHGVAPGADVAETAPSPSEPTPDPAVAEAVATALAALPASQATAVRLHLAEGLTVAEAGAMLGVSGQAVNQAVSRARARLQCTLYEVFQEVRT